MEADNYLCYAKLIDKGQTCRPAAPESCLTQQQLLTNICIKPLKGRVKPLLHAAPKLLLLRYAEKTYLKRYSWPVVTPTFPAISIRPDSPHYFKEFPIISTIGHLLTEHLKPS